MDDSWVTETDSTVLGTDVGDTYRDVSSVGVTLSFTEVATTKVGRSLGLPVTLGDTLGISIPLIDSKELLLGIEYGSAERDSSDNGGKLGF